MRHPTAHWLMVYAKGASGTAVVLAVGWEAWRLLTTVRQVAEHAVEEVVSEILVTHSRAQEALREAVDEGHALLAMVGKQVAVLGIQLGRSVQSWMDLLRPNPFVLLLLGVYVTVLTLERLDRHRLRQIWEALPWAEPTGWSRTAKQQLADGTRRPTLTAPRACPSSSRMPGRGRLQGPTSGGPTRCST